MNRQIAYRQSKCGPFGMGHHQVRPLGAFAATDKRNRGQYDPNDPNSVYGGRRPVKDCMFDSDDVYLRWYHSLFVRAIMAAGGIAHSIHARGTLPAKRQDCLPRRVFLEVLKFVSFAMNPDVVNP